MSSSNYKLEGGNLNSSSASQTSSGFRLIDLVGQTSAQIFTAKGFVINPGLFNNSFGTSLDLSIDKSAIEFESNPSTNIFNKKINLNIKTGNFPGYQLFISETTPLATETGQELPGTLCDALNNKSCSIEKANRWENKTSYGYGYNISGDSATKDFLNKNYFRPFASLDSKQKPALVAFSTQRELADTLNLTLKLALPSSKNIGIYHNILNFQLVPGY